MDEMIELFSVMNQLEKGALGLFFEMNYFVGVFLSIYISWFCMTTKPPKFNDKYLKNKDGKLPKIFGDKEISADDFTNMYNWLYFHWMYLFVSLVFSLAVWMIYSNINGKLSTKDSGDKGG